jgi:spermidine/putrescine transport system permease protein
MAVNLDLSGSGNYNRREKKKGRLLALPAIIYLGVFFIIPLIFVFIISFMTRGSGRGGEGFYTMPFTLQAYQDAIGRIYGPVILDSVVIAFITTVFCLILGYPLAFFIATRKSKAKQQFALFLVILPFWTNFLVRTYTWRIILGNEGIINGFLQGIGLTTGPIQMLNTDFAVLVGLIYGYLPFMVLPIYASVERFDFRLVEAAYDLGANDWRAFWRVVLPLTLPGVVAGMILVFIPVIGALVTPELLGGTQGIMIGSLIQNQFLKSGGNWPLGAAISMVMMSFVLIALMIYAGMTRRRS